MVVVVAVVAALALASVVRQLRYQRQRLVTRLGLLHQGGRRLSAACHHRQQGRTHAAERNGIIDVGLRCLVRKLIRQLQLDRPPYVGRAALRERDGSGHRFCCDFKLRYLRWFEVIRFPHRQPKSLWVRVRLINAPESPNAAAAAAAVTARRIDASVLKGKGAVFKQ